LKQAASDRMCCDILRSAFNPLDVVCEMEIGHPFAALDWENPEMDMGLSLIRK